MSPPIRYICGWKRPGERSVLSIVFELSLKKDCNDNPFFPIESRTKKCCKDWCEGTLRPVLKFKAVLEPGKDLEMFKDIGGRNVLSAFDQTALLGYEFEAGAPGQHVLKAELEGKDVSCCDGKDEGTGTIELAREIGGIKMNGDHRPKIEVTWKIEVVLEDPEDSEDLACGRTYYWLSVPSLGPADDGQHRLCLLYTSPSPRDLSTSRMPSSA